MSWLRSWIFIALNWWPKHYFAANYFLSLYRDDYFMIYLPFVRRLWMRNANTKLPVVSVSSIKCSHKLVIHLTSHSNSNSFVMRALLCSDVNIPTLGWEVSETNWKNRKNAMGPPVAWTHIVNRILEVIWPIREFCLFFVIVLWSHRSREQSKWQS